MPNVQTNAKQDVALTAKAVLAVATLPNITAEEVEACAKACAAYTEAGKAQRKAEATRDKHLASIFEKALGLDLDVVKTLNPEQLAVKLTQRMTAKQFTYEKDFDVVNTGSRKSISWKEEYTKAAGEAATKAVEEAAQVGYSYVIAPKP